MSEDREKLMIDVGDQMDVPACPVTVHAAEGELARSIACMISKTAA
jgi:hypothetical protein